MNPLYILLPDRTALQPGRPQYELFVVGKTSSFKRVAAPSQSSESNEKFLFTLRQQVGEVGGRGGRDGGCEPQDP